MLRALRRADVAWAFLVLEREQLRDLHVEHSGKLLQSRHRWRVHPALDQTDKVLRATDLFRKRHLRQFPRLAQFGDPLAKFLLKHSNEISRTEADGNGAKLRVGLSVIAAAVGRCDYHPSHHF